MRLDLIPIRAEHILLLQDNDGNNIYKLQFLQGLAWETIHYSQMTTEKKGERLVNLVQQKGEMITKSDTNAERLVIRRILQDNIHEYVQTVSDLYHKTHESIYKDITKAPSKGEKRRRGCMASSLMMVCDTWNVPGMDALLSNYTREQVQWMIDACIFKQYETTDEGRAANNKLWKSEGLSAEQQKILSHFSN